MQIFFDGLFAKKFSKISLQNLCNPFPYIIHQNLKTERFSLLQEKVVNQAVCLRTQAVSIKARFKA